MNVLPVQSIEMKVDSGGLKYFTINQARCINCQSCKRICSVLLKDSKYLQSDIKKIYKSNIF